jgi:biotin carboxyl carrier protein
MKTIKFDLPINGTKVKNLDELRDNLTDEILTLARSSQLERWLRTRQLPDQAQAVATAVRSEGTDKGLFLALCRVLEVEAHPGDVKAIFDAPPAPGRFISGARYFELYEALKSSMDGFKSETKYQNVKSRSSQAEPPENLTNLKATKNIKFYPYSVGSTYNPNVTGGDVAHVYIKKGDKVLKGSLVMEVQLRNFTSKIYSPITGVVQSIFVEVGQYIEIGGNLMSVAETQS